MPVRGSEGQESQLCTAPGGCNRPVHRVGLCWGHAKRKQRGLSLAVVLAQKNRPARQTLAEAALHYADASEDGEYHRAWDRLRKAAVRYGQAE